MVSQPERVGCIMGEVSTSLVEKCTAATVLEYLVVDSGSWDDFRCVMRARGFEFTYSVEDCETGGVEYHIYSHLGAADDTLWAIQAVRVDTGR